MKALVTGGTGFIGSQVVDRLLEEGHAVRLFSRKGEVPERLKGKNVEAFRGDLEDPSSVIGAMEGVDVFYHVGEIKNTTRAATQRNVRLMERILERLESKGVKRLVFISSVTVSGIPSTVPADEETKPDKVLHDQYTWYKRRCEELIAAKRCGVEYAIVRPAPVYGPGSRYLGRLIRSLEKAGLLGFPFVGNARNLAPLIYVKDLARAIYLAGIKPAASGQIFILTDGLRHTWFDFFSSISEALGKKLRIFPFPPLMLKMPAIPFDLFSGIFGLELNLSRYADYFSRDIYFDNARARSLLDWQPGYGLDEGVREMVRSYRGQSDR